VAELRESVEVPVDAATVWRALTDWERQGEWMLITRVTTTAQDGQGVGGGIEGWTGIGPVGFRDSMVIRTWDPPRRCIVRHSGWPVRGAGIFEIEPLGPSRARFTWGEVLDLPFGLLGRLGFALLRPGVAWGVRLSLRRFASWVPQWAAANPANPADRPSAP